MGAADSKVDPSDQKGKDHPDNDTLKHEGWSSITEKKRSCTDILFLILLIAAWFAMTIVGFSVCGLIKSEDLKAGNPNRLIAPMDYNGRICGVDPGVKNKPYGYYMYDKSLVCIKECPTTTIEDYTKSICKYSVTTPSVQEFLKGNCMIQMKSSNVLNRCIPDAASSFLKEVSQNYTTSAGSSIPQGSSSWFSSFIGDVYNYQGYIFGFGLGVATAVAFGYLYVLRLPGFLTLVIWGILLSILLFLLIGSFLLWSLANTWNTDGEHRDYQVKTMYAFSYIGMALSALYFCLLFVMHKRIALAVGVVKEAAKALSALPYLLFMPVFQAVAIVIFLVPWIIYVFFMASSGEVVTKVGTTSYYDSMTQSTVTTEYSYRMLEYETNTKYAFLYMLFCWFWTSEFLIACGQLMIALAFVAWYFTRDKSTIGNKTVMWSFRTLTFNHLGTAAFGSLTIAIVKTIRAVIAYMQNQAKKQKNKIMEYAMCMLQCCMWCLEKCMKFLNKNAYILTAIYGDSFCKAARRAFFLLLRNILRVMAVNMVADFVLMLGKLFVPVVTVFLCYLCLAYGVPNGQISGIVSPLVFVGILAYFISLMFSEIFGMGIETILLCYIADEEMFQPADRFADGDLRNTMQKTQQAAASAKVEPATEVNKPEPSNGETLL